MTAETVQPLIEPALSRCTSHVEHLFGGYLDGCHEGKVELAWCDGKDRKLKHAAIFGTDELDELVERAVQVNRIRPQRGRHGVVVKEHGVPKASAQDLLNSWFANGVVADEVFDTHRKATGLRVLRFIDD